IGTGGDGAAYQDFFGTGSPLTSDVAFGLTGTVTAVPEPSSLALGGLGVALAAGWKLRKRRRAAAAG
ncbi:MAG TPA: PEP-CTERM sorting domain-containing protein, partial [Isosphaeraceae bacterium]